MVLLLIKKVSLINSLIHISNIEIDKVSNYSKKRLESLIKYVQKDITVNENDYDSDDDMYQ